MMRAGSSVDVSRHHAGAAPVPAVEVRGVHHEFGAHAALRELDLQVSPGQFHTLLGPSGSGKAALLRIIAGLLTPTGGEVHIAGRDVTHVDVQDRNIGFVFQNYALFPHLSVYDNIQFALKLRRDGRDKRRARVAEMVELVQLGGLENRHPAELSGGQQQRVAIARALALESEVLLLDEPLGALDRRLRQQLGAELRRIQQETSIAAIYVTYDQEEAFVLSDTVVVMSGGAVHQVGAPVDVYARPKDLFVATFLGDTNVLRGTVARTQGDLSIVHVGGVDLACALGTPAAVGTEAVCSPRPEEIRVGSDPYSDVPGVSDLGQMVLEQRVFVGGRYRLTLSRGNLPVIAEVPTRELVPGVGGQVHVVCRAGAPVVVQDAKSEVPPSNAGV